MARISAIDHIFQQYSIQICHSRFTLFLSWTSLDLWMRCAAYGIPGCVSLSVVFGFSLFYFASFAELQRSIKQEFLSLLCSLFRLIFGTGFSFPRQYLVHIHHLWVIHYRKTLSFYCDTYNKVSYIFSHDVVT